jgi:hypothetical protein
VKRSKKQYVSPEVVPSEWDRDSDNSSKSDKTKITKKNTNRPVESAPKTSVKPIEVSKNSTDKDESAVKAQSTIVPPKKKPSIPSKLKDPLPSVDPFKSKEKVSKLIDKDSISHLTFKKTDQRPLAKTTNNLATRSIDSTSNDRTDHTAKAPVPVPIDRLSEAAKVLLNGPTTFNKPVDKSSQKILDNYFVPQGRTGRSISSRSSEQPQNSLTSDSVAQSDSSDLDIITG